jgi:hypothetical protein
MKESLNMKRVYRFIFLLLVSSWNLTAGAQITNPLPGRAIVKLTPDYLRPVVYALNAPNATNAGTVLALNATNGAVVNEITVGINPTDMAVTPAGDFLYVIHAGSRTISKVDLTSFTVQSSQPISTPSTYSLSNPLYLVANNSGTIYFTDGAWGPEIYSFDYASGNQTLILNTGGNQSAGAGGLVLSKTASTLYIWQQYGWSAGSINSSIVSFSISNNILTTLTSGPNQNRDPLNTPIFLDAVERWVFNKVQKVAATNTAVLLTQFTDNIYAVSLDGSVAFGPTEVFNAQTGISLTNLPFSATVQSLSGDQKKLFRYNSSTASVVIYDMSGIASISGPAIVPTPADSSVVAQAPTNLLWSPSATALSYDVYFGTNQAAVAAATMASPLYLGRTTATSIPPGQQPTPGNTYYWRVDTIGFNATNQGPVWSFTVSPVGITPAQISAGGIAGYNPANVTLSLTSAAPTAWSAAVTGSPWLTLSLTNGTTPAVITVSFNTASFAVGTYTNNIEFTIGGLKVEVPVTVNVAALNITKMAADRVRPYIYALQPPALSGQNGRLLFINTLTGNIDLTLPIGINPTDLTVHYGENRLYIASWTEGATYVVDLNNQTLLPSLNLGTDIYKINAGRTGRIITEGEDQWIAVNLVDTVAGTVAGSFPYPEREGDGAADPSGNFYFHCDNNISDAYLHKFVMTNDSPVEVAGSPQHPYGTRNLVMSADGSRLFWNSYEYDINLNELGTLGTEIYCCNSNGSVAFGATQALDATTRLAIYNLPVSTSISVVDGQNKNFWYFNSANATLGSVPMTVIESPSITQQPAANTGVTVGNAVYLTVSAMGLAPLSYQWTFGGTNLPAATNYFLSLTSVQTSQQGSYRVIVANPIGSVTSAVANVTVLVPPSITNQSPSTHVLAGQPINLSVAATGSTPLSYSWMFQNSLISGATTSNLIINNAQQVNEGIYQAVVANSVGSATSAVISVRVDPAGPTIASGPASQTLPASSNATFTVTASGSQPLAYQWFFKSAPIPGAGAAQYSLSGIQASNSGSYYVLVSNAIGVATSAVATLTVTPLAPYFTTQPVGASVSGGSSRTFTGIANGSQPITYQWQHNSTNIPGATSTSFTLTNLAFSDGGPYMVIASNTAGTTPSSIAQLTVYQTPTLVGPLTNQVVDAGSSVALSANVLGSPTLVYTWRLNGQLIAGTNSALSLSNIQPSQSGYYSVTVTNSFGGVSSTSRVSVLGPISTVVAWGDNSGGQLNVPPNLADIVAVAGGDYHTVVLHHNGTLLAWGYDGNGQTNVPTNALPFVTIASGTDHSLAVTAAGSLAAWGRNDLGQCNIPTAASNSVLAVAAGDAHSLALLSGGLVTAWGNNSYGQLNIPPGLSGVTAIAAGREHCLALRTNGTVVGWGYNAYRQASPPASLSNVVAIAGGYLHSVALLSNKTVVVWGDGSFGQTNVPAGLSNVVAIASGDFNLFALLANGRIVGWGDDSYGQTDVPGTLNNVLAVASGNYDGLALIPTAGLLSAALSPAGLILSWPGNATLQWAPAATGPFTDMLTGGNRYTNTDMTAPEKFFRLHR